MKNIDINSLKDFFRSSILFYFTLFITLTFLLTIGFITFRFQQVQKELLHQELEHHTKRIEHYLDETVNYTANVMNYMARQIANHNKKDDLKYIHELFVAFGQDPKIQDTLSWTIIGWVDQQHRAIVDGRYGIMTDNPIDLSTRDYIPHTVTHPFAIHLGKVVSGSTSKKSIIPAGVGVVNDKGIYLGSLVIGFATEKLKSNLDELLADTNLEYTLIGRNQSIIVSTSKTPENFILEGIKDINLDTALEYEDSNISIFENHSSFFERKLEAIPLAIRINFKEGYTSSVFWKNMLSNAWQYIIIAIPFLIIATLLRSRIFIPIHKLSEIAEIIGQGNRKVRVPRQKSKELHVLAKKLLLIQKYRNHEIKKQKILEKERKLTKATNEKLEQVNKQLKDKIALIEMTKKSESAKIALAGKIRGQMRAPIAAIEATVEMLQLHHQGKVEYQLNKEEQESCYRQIYKCAQYIKTMTTETLNITEVNMRNILEEAITVSQKIACLKEVLIEANISNTLPSSFYADDLKIKQIFAGLIAQRMVLLDRGKYISLTASHIILNKETYLQVVIEDNGDGLSIDKQEEITHMMEQSTQQDFFHDGIHLKASTIERLVKMHEGTITYDHKEKKGSKVTIMLPYRDLNDIEQPEPDLPPSSGPPMTEGGNDNNNKVVTLFPNIS